MKKLFTLFTLLLVVCGMRATTVEVTIANYAASNGWSNGTQYPSISLDDNITATATGGGNTGKYYTNGNQWRIYQNETPKLTITAASGYTLNTVTVTYASYNNGVLLQGSTQIASDTEVSASGNSIEFGVGNTGSATNGQVRVTKITVTYSGSSDTRQATTIELGGGYMTKFTYGPDGDGVNLPTATVKAGDTEVTGATVTWTAEKVSGNDALTPTISGNKINIPNHSYGKLNVTASYAGDAASYQPSTKSYTLDVYKGRQTLQEIIKDYENHVVNGGEDWSGGIPTSLWMVEDYGGGLMIASNPKVTYVNGSYTYIQDDYNYNLLLYGRDLGFSKGDVITGDQGGGELAPIYGNLKTYNGLLELEVTQNNFQVESSGATVTPETITTPLMLPLVSSMNAYLKIEDAVYKSANGRSLTFTADETDFTVYQNWTNVAIDGLEVGATYTLEGMGAKYNDTPQLYLISFEKTADATAIKNIDADAADANAPIYNLAGQQVTDSYKGVVIQNGKKRLNK